ncbi:MAG TPA: hypothetical protein VMG59_04630 [Phycisphaerae bacterium]|nr:hypothetical protein [Phycisphaerae bacterium]
MKNRYRHSPALISIVGLVALASNFSCMLRADSDSPNLAPQNNPTPTATASVAADESANLFDVNFLESQLSPTSSPTFSMDDAATQSSYVPIRNRLTNEEKSELTEDTLNPISDLTSVMFQYNVDFGVGPKETSLDAPNIQPQIPISLGPDWDLITRTVIPYVYAPSPANGISTTSGLGDITTSLFFSPRKTLRGWIWGVGPAFLFPTATDPALGSQKWGAGPAAAVLRQNSIWTYGILAQQIWSFAGNSQRSSVNFTYLQPFVSYTFPTFTAIRLDTESTYNWTGRQWIVPINLGASQVFKIGKQPMSVYLGGRYYAQGPYGGPDWGFRFGLTILFPND